MTVYELSREQLDELKANYFWSDDYKPVMCRHWSTGELVPVLFPGDIPDEIIMEVYKDTYFVNDDFTCSANQ